MRGEYLAVEVVLVFTHTLLPLVLDIESEQIVTGLVAAIEL